MAHTITSMLEILLPEFEEHMGLKDPQLLDKPREGGYDTLRVQLHRFVDEIKRRGRPTGSLWEHVSQTMKDVRMERKLFEEVWIFMSNQLPRFM